MLTMKKTTYGIFGIVAIAAILSISVVASGFGNQTATAAPANKFAFAEDNASVALQWTATGGNTGTSSVVVGPVDVKSSDKNNWHIGFTGECKNFSEVQAKGKKGDNPDLSGAVSAATATLVVDGKDHPTVWKLCENDLQIEADLNALIEWNDTLYCTDDQDPLCGGLDFVCDDPSADLSEACWQWVAVSSAVSGAYHTEWVVEGVDAGDHTYAVRIDLTAGASGDNADPATDEPNGVESMVTITNKILTADTVHIANPNALP